MFRCIFIREKLYDYQDNSLSELEKSKVEEHLKDCPDCSKRLFQMKELLTLVEHKNIPKPSEDFWHKFKIELDDKLNARLVTPLKLKPVSVLGLKPELAITLVSVFLVIIALGVHLRNKVIIANSDTQLLDEISILEEIKPEIDIANADEASFDELYLLDQQDQDSA